LYSLPDFCYRHKTFSFQEGKGLYFALSDNLILSLIYWNIVFI